MLKFFLDIAIKHIYVLNKNEVFKDSIVLSLFLNDTVVKQDVFSSGEYSFDSLQAGTYSIGVFKDSVLIGKEQHIKLNTDEKKTIFCRWSS